MRFVAAAILLLVSCLSAVAQDIKTGVCDDTVGVGNRIAVHPCAPGGGGGFQASCPASAAFFARAPSFNISAKKNYDGLICNLETAGVGCTAKLDALYVLAAPNAAASLLNLCSADGTITPGANWAFVPGRGYNGDGSATGFGNTNIAPSGTTKFQQDSGTIGGCDLTNRNTDDSTAILGSQVGGVVAAFIQPKFNGSANWAVSSQAPSNQLPSDNANGLWIASRTSATSTSLYKNGIDLGGDNVTPSATGLNVPFYISAINDGGTATSRTTDLIGFAFIGASMTDQQAQALSIHLNAFAIAQGISGC